MEIEINPQFQRAMELMETTSKHLFITGKAGTGKSTLLDYFCDQTGKGPVVLAPTGVAALNVKGQTVHRFFNFYIDVTPEKIRRKNIRPRDPKLYQQLTTLVIDEVSMLRADLLDCIDTFLRLYGPKKSQPFGGVQMIFVGDLYQLPPVVNNEERDIFRHYYATPYFFSAKALESIELEIVELEKVYRQKDASFIALLNKIRNNSVEDSDIEELNQRYLGSAEGSDQRAFRVTLTGTNKKASQINEEHLNALDGESYSNQAVIEGEFGREYYPTDVELKYKVGAQIMLLNNDKKQRWVNGSMAVIEAVDAGEECLWVRVHEGEELFLLYPFVWEIYKFSVQKGKLVAEPVGSFSQYPFRLAWAITIHKSQGKTFDMVKIDLGSGTFASGQAYVALSRCTSFDGLQLEHPVKKKHIRVDPRIYKFLTGYAYQKAAESLSFEEKVEMIERAIEQKTKLEMTYLKSNDSKSRRVIVPISIGEEEYRGHSFPGVLAYCMQRREERMFNVARILELKPA